MRRLILLFIFMKMGVFIYSQDPSREQFDSLISRAEIEFNMPDSCGEISIEFMRKIPHNFAVGPMDSSFQIRFWIRPLDTWFEDYNKKSKKKQKESMHPDELCKSMMMLAVLDASGNNTSEYKLMGNPQLVKGVYNADWGALSLIESGWPKQGYKYIMITSIHKDGVGDAYVSVLANNLEDYVRISKLMENTIKFK